METVWAYLALDSLNSVTAVNTGDIVLFLWITLLFVLVYLVSLISDIIIEKCLRFSIGPVLDRNERARAMHSTSKRERGHTILFNQKRWTYNCVDVTSLILSNLIWLLGSAFIIVSYNITHIPLYNLLSLLFLFLIVIVLRSGAKWILSYMIRYYVSMSDHIRIGETIRDLKTKEEWIISDKDAFCVDMYIGKRRRKVLYYDILDYTLFEME